MCKKFVLLRLCARIACRCDLPEGCNEAEIQSRGCVKNLFYYDFVRELPANATCRRVAKKLKADLAGAKKFFYYDFVRELPAGVTCLLSFWKKDGDFFEIKGVFKVYFLRRVHCGGVFGVRRAARGLADCQR